MYFKLIENLLIGFLYLWWIFFNINQEIIKIYNINNIKFFSQNLINIILEAIKYIK